MFKRSQIHVEKRSVYEFGKRKRFAYDARGTLAGIEYCETGASRTEAADLAIRAVSYIAMAGSLVWRFPHGGSYCFQASDLAAALRRICEEYSDHEDSAKFRQAAESYLSTDVF